MRRIIATALVVAAVWVGAAPADASVLPAPMSARRTPVAGAALGGVTVAARIVRGPRTALPTERHSAFPGAARLPDGRLLAVWRTGSEHLSFDGDIWGSWSSDNGQTWTQPTTRYTMAQHDLRDPALALVNGVLYMTFCTSQPGAYGNGVYIVRSTDGGATWTGLRRLDAYMPRAGESGPVVALKDGRLLQMFYGHPAGETRGSLWSVFSSDGGSTWTTQQRVLNGQADGRDYEEPWSMNTATGVKVFTRWGLITEIGSIDFDGSNWSNAHALWSGSARPSCAANGARVLCIYRQADPTAQYRPALMRVSKDGGKTFGASRLFDGTAPMFTYAQPVVFGRGWLAVYAMQSTISSSKVYVRSVQ